MLSPSEMRPTRLLTLLLAVSGWFALVAQFYLILENRTTSVQEAVIRYFSYFTILTNLLITMAATAHLLPGKTLLQQFFSRYRTITALAMYIIIVGVVYNVILRFTWNPQGLQRVVDELLHTINPILFTIIWLAYPRQELRWQDVVYWIVYPFVYCQYIIWRGSISGFYPYPFIDVASLGYPAVLRNCLYLFLCFLTIGGILIGISKWRDDHPERA